MSTVIIDSEEIGSYDTPSGDVIIDSEVIGSYDLTDPDTGVYIDSELIGYHDPVVVRKAVVGGPIAGITYKTPLDMSRKFQRKFSPGITTTRLENVRPIALSRATAGMLSINQIITRVNMLLDQYGILGGARANYIAFAEKLYREIRRQGKISIQKIAEGLKKYYIEAYGCREDILDAIINTII